MFKVFKVCEELGVHCVHSDHSDHGVHAVHTTHWFQCAHGAHCVNSIMFSRCFKIRYDSMSFLNIMQKTVASLNQKEFKTELN